MADVESGTYVVSRELSVVEVEEVCSEVDIALAEALACLDFLGHLSTGDSGRAVLDAHVALVRVADAIEGLKTSCARAAAAYPSRRPPPAGLRFSSK
jgi:hypothetical protein